MDKNNQSAFPHNEMDQNGQKGLTKREWFAGMAMQAIIGNYKDKPPFIGWSQEDFYEKVSSMAYYMADTMLKERLK